MLIGHQNQWHFLTKSVQLNTIPHALLFIGQEKSGKKTLALEFIKWLFQDDIQKRQHPDFTFIEPQKKEIQVSQIRDFIWKLSLKPLSAPLKAAVIDQAHCMNQEAQNCFLKTLEEPKGNTLLILITEYPEMLLPTIISRCEIIKFHPVKKIEIKQYLQNEKISDREADVIVNLCMGKPGVCIDIISNPQELERQKKTIKDLIAISDATLVTRFQYAKNLSQEPQLLGETLDIWLRYLRDILLAKIYKQGTPSPFNNYSFIKLINILKLIQKTNFLISRTNINLKLATENLMLEL